MGARVLLKHHAERVSASSISDEVAEARGYRTVSVKSELKALGFGEAQCRVPALLIPVWSVNGEIATYQIRPDEPRIKDGKPLKYETPAGAHMALDVPPAARPLLANPSLPLFITEGARKADAAVSRGLCCVALLGVWNFRGRNEHGGLTALADWEYVALKGRKAYICFDSDVMEKDAVRLAMKRLRAFLESRGANVRLIYLPAGAGGAKVGLDDYFAAGGTVDGLMRLATADLPDEPETDAKPERKSQATVLVELAGGADYFHTSEGTAYASVEINGHLETWPLKSQGFRDWLLRRFYEEVNKSSSSQAYQDALGVLYGQARFGGETREVHTRIAAYDGAIYVDLADDAWRVVRITVEDWQVIPSADAPVRFRRSRGTLPLTEPMRGGKMAALRRFVNVKTDADWTLLQAWLVASLRPNLPLPLLALYGAQGSAKSTTARVLTSLIDPSKAALRSEPKDERDLMIAARNRWCLTFDNLSHVSNSLSDALCRLATGGGLSTRELYSDDEETLFEALRPVIINGIEDLATRGDLLSRAVVLYLPPLKSNTRLKEADLWREFERARPSICGALYDAVSTALRRVESVRLADLPRMADFAAWAVAAEPAFGVSAGTFMEAYAANRATANTTALDDSPLSEAVIKLLEAQPKPYWSGRASELLEELRRQASEQTLRDKGWPKAPNTLTNKLRRLASSLRAVGVECRESRTGRERARIITLEKMDISSSAPSVSPADEQSQDFSADGLADDLSNADGCSRCVDDGLTEAPSAPNLAETLNDRATTDDADGNSHDFSNTVFSARDAEGINVPIDEDHAFAECARYFEDMGSAG
ncbi:MAG TPA: DUF3854 domain-containing protein [Pyrinomonadaceae bacterium]